MNEPITSRAALFIDGGHLDHITPGWYDRGLKGVRLDVRKFRDWCMTKAPASSLAYAKYYYALPVGNPRLSIANPGKPIKVRRQLQEKYIADWVTKPLHPGEDPIISVEGSSTAHLCNHKNEEFRCPKCDSIHAVGATTCGCGQNLSEYRCSFIVRHQKQVDVSLALDIARACYDDTIDTIILVAADSDFIPAINMVKDFGKVPVVLYGEGPKTGTTAEFRRAAPLTFSFTVNDLYGLQC